MQLAATHPPALKATGQLVSISANVSVDTNMHELLQQHSRS
jgi:hypothetical protein